MRQEVKDALNALADQPDEHFKKLKEFYEEHLKDDDEDEDNDEHISLEEIIKYYKKKPGSNLVIIFKSLNKLALYLREKAKSEEATQLYEAVAANTRETHFNRGFANYQLEQYDEAEQYFTQAPDNELNRKWRSRTKLNQLFERAGEETDALNQQFTTAASIESEESEDADDEAEASSSTSPMPSEPQNPTILPKFEAFNGSAIAATAKERLRQVQTEMHFFSARRNRKPATKDLAKKFQHNRQASTATDFVDQDVHDQPSRRVITADASTVEASVICFGWKAARRAHEGGYQQSLVDWHIASRKPGNHQEELYANAEMITLGRITNVPITYQYTHRLDTHHNHLGNFHSPSVGVYNSDTPYLKQRAIYPFLAGLAGSSTAPNKNNEKKIAKWIREYASNGTFVSLPDLQSICPTANANDLKKLIQIFFHCIIKEPMRWMTPMDGHHDLPLATAQARAIKLISKGYLSLQKVFDEDSDHGVFTATNIGLNPSALLTKINRINKLYAEKILLQPASSEKFVTTRSQLHEELVEMYGGGSDRSSGPDTDGQGYDSDTAHTLYPRRF